MKKQLLTTGPGLALAAPVRATDKIAITSMGSLFQQVAQETGVSNMLESEFKGRASKLQHVETGLQAKVKKLQPVKTGSDHTKLEESVMARRRTFAQRAQAFEQGRARRSSKERGKLVTRTQATVKSVANSQDIDLAIGANAAACSSNDVKDITTDVLRQIK